MLSEIHLATQNRPVWARARSASLPGGRSRPLLRHLSAIVAHISGNCMYICLDEFCLSYVGRAAGLGSSSGGGTQPPVTSRSLIQKLGEVRKCREHVKHACNNISWLMAWPRTLMQGLWSLETTGHLSLGPCMHHMIVWGIAGSPVM